MDGRLTSILLTVIIGENHKKTYLHSRNKYADKNPSKITHEGQGIDQAILPQQIGL